MPLNKFIPLSPDPNITRDSDMGLAQFGHLNTIVDYLNGTKALSNLKIDGTLFFNSYSGGTPSIIITHSSYNQDPLTYIGGGATLIVGGYYSQYLSTPYSQGYGNTVLGIYSSIIAHDNSYFNTVIGYAASVTINEPGNVVIGKSATSSVANAVAIGRNASVSGYEASAIGYGAVTTTSNAVALGNGNSKLQIGGNFVPTARVHIKGSGSTSATTSLLVQNSAGSNALTVRDDRSISAFASSQFCFSNDGLNSGAGNFRVLLLSSSGNTYLDGWSDGTSKAQNYPIVIGSRVQNSGSSITGNTTTENGTPVIFGFEVAQASALVTMNSTTRGFLPPRMTTTQKNAIATPAVGLMVYDTDLNRPCFYSGSAWITL